MTTITYTEAVGVDSSFIDEVIYNANTESLVVALDGGGLYGYEKVPSETYRKFIAADSVGTFYNTVVKPQFGPAKDLGGWDDVSFNFVSKDATVTPITEAPSATKEFGLGSVFDPTVSGAPIRDYVVYDEDDATPEFSLAALPEPEPVSVDGPIDLETEVTVTYLLNGKKAKFKATNLADVQDVLNEFGDVIDRLGLTTDDVKPLKVVYKFSE